MISIAIAQMHDRLDKLVRNSDNMSGENDANDQEYSVETLFPTCNDSTSIYYRLRELIMALDSNLFEVPRKNYVTFKLNGINIVSAWPQSRCIEVVLKAKLGEVNDPSDMIYDISNRRWTSEQYAFKFYDDTDLNAVRNFIKQSYDLMARSKRQSSLSTQHT